MKTCIYCGNDFEPPKPTTPMCQFCWYGGRHHEAERRELFAALRELQGIEIADVMHTGGGCFGLEVICTAGRYLFATVACQDEKGEWGCEATLPEAGEPWALGIYPNQDAFGDCDSESGVSFRMPLTDAELVEAVRELARTE